MKRIKNLIFWIKCHVFDRHLYIINNHGMSDAMFDEVDYCECAHCDSVKFEFDSKAKSYGSTRWYDKLLKNAIMHKRAYNMKIESRRVIVEKYIDFEKLLAKGHVDGFYDKRIINKLRKNITDETYQQRGLR